MKKSIIILILTTIGFYSCKKDSKSTKETLVLVKNVQSKKTLTDNNDKNIYTKYEYTDSNGDSLIIENSFPRGGMKYADPKGEIYVYAIFWTRIVNETNNPFELKIDFPLDSYKIPTLPNKYFKILIPSDTMTLEKVRLFNYGLTNLKSFLDDNINKSSSLKRTINPKQSSGFYVVMLCEIEGAHGTLRTGLSINGQNLFYRINGKEIPCGNIVIKKTP